MTATNYNGWRIVTSLCAGLVQVIYTPQGGASTYLCNTTWRDEEEAMESVKRTIDRLRPTPYPGGEGAG